MFDAQRWSRMIDTHLSAAQQTFKKYKNKTIDTKIVIMFNTLTLQWVSYTTDILCQWDIHIMYDCIEESCELVLWFDLYLIY